MKKNDENDHVKLTKAQIKTVSAKIREYVSENFETDVGNLQAELFLEFISENVGTYYYNKAVMDSMAFIIEKADDLYLLMKDEAEE